MLNKLLNWFRRPKWEEFRDEPYDSLVRPDYSWKDGGVIRISGTIENTEITITQREPQWRTNFSLTAAQRSERSRKAAATRKANKAKSNGE